MASKGVPPKGKKISRDECAVYMRHGYKEFKKPYALLCSDMDMTIMRGCIYGLLGASGCGKTTLLACIVGLRTLDKGELWVLGGKPNSRESAVPGSRIGYMPQETALYGEFTIQETMLYFGWIFNMKSKDINNRLDFLLDLLDLPTKKRLVKNLSGGQQRRVSFATSLMHNPELLILDEPTAGVDPLLRQKIWGYLLNISKDGNKTIIVTTHYIDEAKQANVIGLMRGGKLLAEDSPATLLSTYGAGGGSLEDVFLKLSKLQAESAGKAIKADPPEIEEPSRERRKRNVCARCCSAVVVDVCSVTSCGRLKALLAKNLLRMFRNLGVMLFLFVLPVLQVILFCVCIGGDPNDLKLSIVNEEVNYTDMYHIHCDPIAKCQKNPPGITLTLQFRQLSCIYLKWLNIPTIEQNFYPDLESGKEAVRNGSTWGVVHFTKNFTDAIVARMLDGPKATPDTLRMSEIDIWLDTSNQQIAFTLQRDLHQGFYNFSAEILKECYVNPHLITPPVFFRDPIYGYDRPTFTAFAAPGVLLTIVYFLAVALTSSALIAERVEGLLDRSYVAGVNALEILFSHVSTQFIVMAGQTILALVCMIVIFKVQCDGSVVLVVILTLLQGLLGMCIGFVISAMCSHEKSAIQMALGSFYPIILLSGVIWPIESMPVGVRYVAIFMPLTLATSAMRSIMLRGWEIDWPDVYLGYIATCSWIMVLLITSLIIIRFKED